MEYRFVHRDRESWKRDVARERQTTVFVMAILSTRYGQIS